MMARTTTALLCASLALVGCGRGASQKPEPEPGPAARSAEPHPAATARPDETREILSLISVEHEVDVLAQRDGVVVEILRDQGAKAVKGDVLARLDDRDLVAQIDKARAELVVAENNVRYNEAEVRAKQAAFRRVSELRQAGLQSEADYEKAEFEAKGAQYDLAAWRAKVDSAQAEIRRLEVDLQKTRLRAPFPGVVARRYVRGGQNVLKDDKCFRLSELAPLQVRFLVPETSARRAKVGDGVNVVATNEGGRAVRAVIRKVSPVVDAASGSVEVMAELTGPDLEGLRPGTAVRVLWSAASPAP